MEHMEFDMEFDMSDVYHKSEALRAEINAHRKKTIVMAECHVIQLRNFNGQRTCIPVYENETLYEFYDKANTILYGGYPEKSVTTRRSCVDIIPDPCRDNETRSQIGVMFRERYGYEKNRVYELFVVNKNEDIMNVPCSKTVSFGEFKKKHSEYFIPSSRIPILNVMKAYVIDNSTIDYLNRKEQEKYGAFLSQIKRLFSCRL